MESVPGLLKSLKIRALIGRHDGAEETKDLVNAGHVPISLIPPLQRSLSECQPFMYIPRHVLDKRPSPCLAWQELPFLDAFSQDGRCTVLGFITIYGGQEPRRNRVVVPARQAT